MGSRSLFTDEQIWLVMNAPSNINSVQLADMMGRKRTSVRMLRVRLRNEPWACRISWDPCGECGEPLIRTSSIKRFHDHCRPAARRKLHAKRQKVREEHLTKREREERTARGAAFHAKVHEITLRTATNRGAPWSEDDDQFLIENNGRMSLTEMAIELGRTYSSCHSRLGKLRGMGMLG